MEKEKRRKIISYTIDAILGAIIVFLLSCQIQMLVTSSKNYGVPRAYGLSFLYVGTDSMVGEKEDSLNRGTGIIVQQTSAASLRQGDVVTFFDKNLGAPNTHRLSEEPYIENGVYHFHTMGDNAAAATFDYQGEFFTDAELIGKVIAHNDGLGTFLTFVSPNASGMAQAAGNKGAAVWLFPIVVLIPLAGIAAVSIAGTVHEARKQKKEDEAELNQAMEAAGIDRSDEAAVTKFAEKYRFKKEYREELEKEKEKARRKAIREIKAQERRAKYEKA